MSLNSLLVILLVVSMNAPVFAQTGAAGSTGTTGDPQTSTTTPVQQPPAGGLVQKTDQDDVNGVGTTGAASTTTKDETKKSQGKAPQHDSNNWSKFGRSDEFASFAISTGGIILGWRIINWRVSDVKAETQLYDAFRGVATPTVLKRTGNFVMNILKFWKWSLWNIFSGSRGSSLAAQLAATPTVDITLVANAEALKNVETVRKFGWIPNFKLPPAIRGPAIVVGVLGGTFLLINSAHTAILLMAHKPSNEFFPAYGDMINWWNGASEEQQNNGTVPVEQQ